MIDFASVVYKSAAYQSPLDRCTAIVGPMRSGKSSYLEGIRDALTPDVGKRQGLWRKANRRLNTAQVNLVSGDDTIAKLSFDLVGKAAHNKQHELSDQAPVVLAPPDLGGRADIVRERIIARFADPSNQISIDNETRKVLDDVGVRLPKELSIKHLGKFGETLRSVNARLSKELSGKRKLVENAAASGDLSGVIKSTRDALDQAVAWERSQGTRDQIAQVNDELQRELGSIDSLTKRRDKQRENANRGDVKSLKARVDRGWQLREMVKYIAKRNEHEITIVPGIRIVVEGDPSNAVAYLDERIERNTKLLDSLESAPNKLHQIENSIAIAERSVERLRSRQVALQDELDRWVGNEVWEGETSNEIRARLRRLEEQHNESASIRVARAHIDRIEWQRQVIKQLESVVRAKIEEVVGGLKQRVESKLNAYMPAGFKCNFSLGTKAIHIAMVGSDGEPSYSGEQSGSEQAILQTALTLAWGADVEPSRRLLLLDDQDFSGFSAAGCKAYLEKLSTLVDEGELAQVIITRHEDRASEIPRNFEIVYAVEADPVLINREVDDLEPVADHPKESVTVGDESSDFDLGEDLQDLDEADFF